MKILGSMKPAFAVIFGLAVGFIIGQATEMFTSDRYSSVKKIAEQSQTGSGTNIPVSSRMVRNTFLNTRLFNPSFVQIQTRMKTA